MKLIILLLISIIVVVFAIQNSTIVTVTLFNKTFDGSLALVIILCYLLGVLSGFLYVIPTLIRKNLTISDLKQKLSSQAKDLNNPL
ncbi:MAG: LapA family protein [Proteobacteria bacterium]|nr:LapA family protein [Pseudomonadota bacterium]